VTQGIAEALEEAILEASESARCTRLSAQTADRSARSLSNLQKENLFTVGNATRKESQDSRFTGAKMYICKKCRGHRIKTRINKSFGKSSATPVKCKDCSSTDIEAVDAKSMRRFGRRR
jgi:hypothetical protein